MNASKHYSESSLWRKLGAFAAAAGKQVVEKVLIVYEVLKDSETPGWAKAVIVGALGYFISPIDVIPDFIPVVGFTDDFSALAGAIATVVAHVKPSHIAIARSKMDQWFGRRGGA